jgi:transposase
VPRRWKQTFRCKPLEELAGQLIHSPPQRRREQCRRAEKLHDEIEAQTNYPLDYIAYRLTRFRLERDDSVLLVGQAVAPDLRLLIDILSRSTAIEPSDAKHIETAAQLSKRMHVSAKTIARWRQRGLRWRWETLPGRNRKEVVFERTAVKKFIAEHDEHVQRAAGFRSLPDDERDRLIARATRITKARSVSLNEVAAHLSRRTGRALETVRLILEKHDTHHRDDAIFPDRNGPLTARQQRVICRAQHMGVSVIAIANRFKRTPTTIYRVIHQRRASAARRLDIPYIVLPTFDRDDADEVILRPNWEPQRIDPPSSALPLADLPAPLVHIYSQPTIAPDDLRSLFIRYNYLKYQAAAVRAQLDQASPRVSDLNRFDKLLSDARAAGNLLTRSTLSTVLSVARRHLLDAPDASSQHLMQLLAQGNAALLEAINQFDPTRPQTFTTFLTNRLMQLYVSDSNQPTAAPRRARPRHDPLPKS